MSLIVEDGTGVAGAESYASVAAADTRHSALGNSAWAGFTLANKEAYLRRATNYLEQAYRERWRGLRLHLTQPLSWPRWGVMVDNFPVYPTIVPPEVVNACADLALKAASADLNSDLNQMVVETGVGPVRKRLNPYSPQQTRYRSIEMALAPFLRVSGATVQAVRG